VLTRLHIKGFKNLYDVDVRFGPFTCVAGANGSGKSNLFDAILFLGALSEKKIVDAALSVRGEADLAPSVRNIFYQSGKYFDGRIFIEAEMIIPLEGEDDFRQLAKAKTTFLTYKIELKYKQGTTETEQEGIELLHEELTYIQQGNVSKHILFKSSSEWRKSAVQKVARRPFITTDTDKKDGLRKIKLHQQMGKAGRARSFLAEDLPRTILSSADAEYSTVLLAKREMQSWQQRMLEPSAMRAPDSFTAPSRLGLDGSHLPATLHRLSKTYSLPQGADNSERAERFFDEVSHRLSELIGDIYTISVDRDEKRQLYTLLITEKNGSQFTARELSDGTLRFLAIITILLDTESHALICLEEPENGIHPARIPAIISLLQDICTDTEDVIDEDNPLRQVIVNTHSPSVVAAVPDDSLLMAETYEVMLQKEGSQEGSQNIRGKAVRFCALEKTWRAKIKGQSIAPKGRLLDYLNSIGVIKNNPRSESDAGKRVVDRKDFRTLLPCKK
jgi:predicted ATPase